MSEMARDERDTNGRSRWDLDERGTGIADGAWIAPSVALLQAALAQPLWVAEAPEDHLLPHLERACTTAGSPWRLRNAELRADGVYAVDLIWEGEPPRLRQLRADAFSLIGEIAEGSTFVRQVVAGDFVEYHVATGLLEGDTRFAPHGHLLLMRVSGPGVPAMVAGTQGS
jgi:hypothetical protein